MSGGYQNVSLEEIRRALPQELPAGVGAIIRNYYGRDPISFNTDWAGTMPMWGLAMWAKRGVPGALEYVQAWFEAHLKRDPGLSDEEFFKTYTGHRSRVIRGQQLPFTMYSGLFGLVFPCSELFKQTGDERARQACLDVADAILYRGRRNGIGLAAHDDHWDAGRRRCVHRPADVGEAQIRRRVTDRQCPVEVLVLDVDHNQRTLGHRARLRSVVGDRRYASSLESSRTSPISCPG